MRSESGQATLEFSAILLWLALAALVAWQLGLTAWTYVSANNAARSLARLYSRTGDMSGSETEVKDSLSGIVSSGASVGFVASQDGEKAVVTLKIPLVFPGLVKSGFVATGDATMPHTG